MVETEAVIITNMPCVNIGLLCAMHVSIVSRTLNPIRPVYVITFFDIIRPTLVMNKITPLKRIKKMIVDIF